MGTRSLASLVARLRRDERGFTMVELMFAIGILVVTMFTLAYTATIGFRDIGMTRQRQSADGLANKTMEQVRALPYDTVKKGLDNTDLAAMTDPNITKTGGGVNLKYWYGGEEIPRGDNPTVLPLVPHRADVVVGPTTFHRSVYVTYYQNDKTTKIYRVTVLVTWDVPTRVGSSTTVKLQSLVYSPAGCLSTATHPFAAPCQAYLYGSTSTGQGSITVSGTIAGVSLERGTLTTTRDASDAQIEQVQSVLGSVMSSGASLKMVGQSEQFLGGNSVSSGADDDPTSSGSTAYSTASLPAQTGTTLSATGPGTTFTVASSGNDTGTTTSASAALPPTQTCADRTGFNQTDSLPCGNSKAQQMGTMSSTLSLTAGVKVLASTLASVASAPSASVAYTNRDIPSGDGLVQAQASRSVGTISLGGKPSNVTGAPNMCSGYLVQVVGFTDTVTSEAGATTTAPTAVPAGTINYWNGTTCSSLTIAQGAGVSVPVGAVHVQDPATGPGPYIVLDMSASLSTGGTTKTDPANCGTSCKRTTASATSNSPLVGTISYRVTYNGNVLADLTITIDLGPLSSKTSYQTAPSRL